MEMMQFMRHSLIANNGSIQQRKFKVLTKTLYEQKGYNNAGQITTKFPNKG